jgi:CO dehydrogenase maturation factor
MLEAANALQAKRTDDSGGGIRIVVTGKGGVGKTTLSALLAKLFVRDGIRVLAVDEDPQQNLAFSLGYPKEKAKDIVPLSQNLDYIEEKTGARPGVGWGLMLTLNPNVADVVDRFGIPIEEGLDLLVMGSVVQAATGCLCPENALLESVIRYIRLRNDEAIILDTQAGVEHFGRALAEGFSQTIVVTEPGFNSVQVALHSAELASQLNIPAIYLVVNKVRNESDRKKVEHLLGTDHPFAAVFYLPYDDAVLDTEPDVTQLLDGGRTFTNGIREIYARVSSCPPTS